MTKYQHFSLRLGEHVFRCCRCMETDPVLRRRIDLPAFASEPSPIQNAES